MSAAARISADDFANQAAAHFATTPGKLFIPASYNTNRGDPIYRDEQDAFPAVKVPYRPLGSTVFVQLRLPPLELTGMFEVNDEDRRTERDNQQVGKVVAVGPRVAVRAGRRIRNRRSRRQSATDSTSPSQ